ARRPRPTAARRAAVPTARACPNTAQGGGAGGGPLPDPPPEPPAEQMRPHGPAQSPHNHRGEPIGGTRQRRPGQPTPAARRVYITNSTNEHPRQARPPSTPGRSSAGRRPPYPATGPPGRPSPPPPPPPPSSSPPS